MADEMKDWIHVRVACRTCKAWVYVSWPPDDRGLKFVKHGNCPVFTIGRKEALLEQLRNAVEQEMVESGPGLPGIRQPGRYVHMRSPRVRKIRDNGDPGDEEEAEK